MIRKVLVALGLVAAVNLLPVAAAAHEGHDHGVKAKKVKKSMLKKAMIEITLRRTTA
jgi:hypothetical protein